MAKIRLTKEFNFEMAHALDSYDGACRHIHGHSYKLFVTVIGTPESDETNPKKGMVLDFSVLKGIVNPLIVNRLDHALVLRDTDAKKELHSSLEELYGKVILVDYQPTCENMIIRFADILRANLPDGIALHHIRLHETATSFAEWFMEDNLEGLEDRD